MNQENPDRQDADLDDDARAVFDLAARALDSELGEGHLLNDIHDLAMTPTAFFYRLRRILDTEAAHAHNPIAVRALRTGMNTQARRRRPYWNWTQEDP